MEATREQLLDSYVLLFFPMLPHDLHNRANLDELIRQAINRVSLEIHDERNERNEIGVAADDIPELVRTHARQPMHERIIAYIRNPPQQQPQQPQQQPHYHTGGLPHKNSQKRSTTRRRRSSKRQSRKMNKRRR